MQTDRRKQSLLRAFLQKLPWRFFSSCRDEKKIVDHKIIVSPNQCHWGAYDFPADQAHVLPNWIRQEILLDKAPAAKVISILQTRYKDIAAFEPHPTMNGFYVTASRKTVLAIKADSVELDRVPKQPGAPDIDQTQQELQELLQHLDQ